MKPVTIVKCFIVAYAAAIVVSAYADMVKPEGTPCYVCRTLFPILWLAVQPIKLPNPKRSEGMPQ